MYICLLRCVHIWLHSHYGDIDKGRVCFHVAVHLYLCKAQLNYWFHTNILHHTTSTNIRKTIEIIKLHTRTLDSSISVVVRLETVWNHLKFSHCICWNIGLRKCGSAVFHWLCLLFPSPIMSLLGVPTMSLCFTSGLAYQLVLESPLSVRTSLVFETLNSSCVEQSESFKIVVFP